MRTSLLIVLFITSTCTYAQAQIKAKTILSKVQKQIDKYTSYKFNVEYKAVYYSSNYNYDERADCYFQKLSTDRDSIRFICQKKENNKILLTSIYSGNDYITLLEDKKQFINEKIILKKLNNKYLRWSVLMIGKALDEVLKDETFYLRINDTTIQEKNYYQVQIEPKNKWIEGFGNWKNLVDYKHKKNYILIIDKKYLLPYQFISQTILKGESKIDFERFIYRNLIVNPAEKEDKVWDVQNIISGYNPYVKQEVKSLQNGDFLPPFKLLSYSPKGIDTVLSSSFKGKVLLVDFWFKGCGPCNEALPHFKELQNKYKEKSFQLISINVEDNQEDIEFYYKKLLPNYPMLFMGNKYFESLGFIGCPTSLLINKNGEILKIFKGFNQEKTENAIDALLDSNLKPE